MSTPREGVRWLAPRLAAFRQNHAAWLARHDQPTEVLYRLPEKIRAILVLRRPHGRPILEPADSAAEEDFDVLCRGFFAAGIYQSHPVLYGHLQPPMGLPSATQFEQKGLHFDRQALTQVTAHAADLQLRIKGYVGRLVTDLPFLQARNTLRAAWLAIPEPQRPGLPLSRTTLPCVPASAAVGNFQNHLDAFCDRYGLQGLATWDLPDPVGPLLAGGPWPAHILQPRQVVIAVPSHFPIMEKDALLEMIRSQQQRHVQEAGLDPTCVGPRSAETYAHLFEIDHYERVVIGRYGHRPRPKGFTSQVNEALMAHLDIGQDHLRTLRKALTAFQRGTPHTGKWTR